jgi:hypothetical protein
MRACANPYQYIIKAMDKKQASSQLPGGNHIPGVFTGFPLSGE